MIKSSLILFALLFTATSSAQHVFYGERATESTEKAVYFDKDGFPYPDYFISDSSMVRAYGSLFTWFQQNNEAFIDLSSRYRLFPETINQETIFRLRDSITAGIARDLNRKAEKYKAVAFYIHGFRKSFMQKNNDVTSVEEFQLLRDDLARYRGEQPGAFEVNVYWDGMYDCCFSRNRKRNKELFLMYEQAGNNAHNAGYGFRKLLLQIESDSIQILAHSLGAKVVAYALFNLDRHIDDSYIYPKTPAQKNIRICLIAPAVDGKIFRTHYPADANDHHKIPENYHFMIVYNEADFVLKKKDPKIGLFGPGAKRYGKTTLGCNWHNDATKLKRYFDKHFPNSELVIENAKNVGKCHSLRCYTKDDHLKAVNEFLWKQ